MPGLCPCFTTAPCTVTPIPTACDAGVWYRQRFRGAALPAGERHVIALGTHPDRRNTLAAGHLVRCGAQRVGVPFDVARGHGQLL